ncbi:McrC family protein (plasmid) [Halorientalis pallida]|uniref:McrC family protein n=1 Tax=Halorientalis pallida TaxID=2479928 RepID=UPI003C6F0E1A
MSFDNHAPEPLTIEERTETVVPDLPTEDITALSEISAVRVTMRDGVPTIEAGNHVGVIGLPTGRLLQIRPKVECNLLYYLAFAGRLDEDLVSDRDASFVTGDSFVDLLGRLFLSELRQIVRRGLHKEYRTRQSDEGYIRGQLEFTKQIQRHGPRSTQFACRYDELTHDIPINQVLYQATDVLLGLVSDIDLRRDLRQYHGEIQRKVSEQATLPRPTEIQLTRLNDHYAPILQLAELIFDRQFIEDVGIGHQRFQSLLIDTEVLFEHVVYRGVELAVKSLSYLVRGDGNPRGSGETCIGHLLTDTDENPIQRLEPDFFLRDQSDNQIVLVGDAKWKDTTRPSREDLYQLTAYQSRLEVPGLLVYPDLSGRINANYEQRRQPQEGNQPQQLRVTELQTTGATDYESFKKEIKDLCRTEIQRLLQ